MSNYKQSDVVGSKWQRVVRVVIENPLSSSPSIMFVEEEVINLGGQTFTNLVANLSVAFEADNPLHLEIYTKLNELYTIAREARDAGTTESI